MKTRISTLILFFLCLTSVKAQQYNQLFSEASEAVKNQNTQKLQGLLLTQDSYSEEGTKALAELIIEFKSTGFDNFQAEYKDALKKHRDNRISFMVFQIFGFKAMPPFGEMPEYSIIEKDDKTILKLKEDKESMYSGYEFVVGKENGTLKFIPAKMQKEEDIAEFYEFYFDWKKVFTENPDEKRKEALDALVAKYVKPTTLTYADSPASGKINGSDWVIKGGMAKKRTSFGKEKISITLFNVAPEKECNQFLNADKVMISLPEAGEYDLALTGNNITLYDSENNKNKMVRDGKVKFEIDEGKQMVTGIITVKLDDDNFVNGTFGVPFCTEKQ
ncbi:hypothetical protein [Mangrovivirga cuniculi]|uniref:DUF4251 domain-containing protein n=1 Tax=Mangrovivirga cuniculi TaxID=2715131 RepID=A0A4D7JHJ5_9BACT|nr:hypothetical protein [Mangrovivirga cuniculi]QCK14177.1 hypothetical protein DCC35_05170 [Mangrovivirga cuniculi]